ncbi:MAG TPA: DUF1549 domain-containing protein [Humisphaera sp.]
MARPAAAATEPATAAKQVSFARDVKPILAHNCYECHAKGKKKGAFALDTRELVLKGGESGPAVVVGKSGESDLVKRLHTDDADAKMPPKGPGLKPEEVAVIKAWIDQGLKWDDVSPADIAARKPQNVAARKPTLPAGDGHPVDRLLAGYFAANKVEVRRVSDEVFARRVYWDIVGLPPTPKQLDAFLKDPSADKRAALVKALLADDKAYADHWMTFWQDHLRDGRKDAGSTDILKPITAWLHASLKANKPYDLFVADLIVASAPKEMTATEIEKAEKDRQKGLTDPTDAEGFLYGQLSGLEPPRGDQAWPVQAAQNIGQVFLGVQLKCATCHDSFIDQWTMADSWSLANVFAEKPLEAVRCAQPTGKFHAARFLYPEMGAINPAAPVAERQRQLAALLTSPKNGRFSRTIANRMWLRLVGRGLVEQADEMDAPAWNPDLLDFLAEDLVEHGFDLKHLIATICTSAAYQMPSVDLTHDAGQKAAESAYVFRGPALRRLTAEQFVDGVGAMLGRDGRAWTGGGTRLLEMLGRPDHRVVITHRDDKASTIQALELLNGQSLYDVLYTDGSAKKATADTAAVVRGSSAPSTKPSTQPATKPTTKPVAKATTKPGAKSAAAKAATTKPAVAGVNPQAAALAKLPPKELADRLLRHGLSRPPSDKEVAILADVLGEKPSAETVADAVWMVAMLPEFQLVR